MTKPIPCIIPARGGSKSVPRKNIKMLGDKPLIGHTIANAHECQYIDKIYVSTEDKEIAEVAKHFGAEVIDRPREFAQDDSIELGLFRHAVGVLNYEGPIAHLRATTPLIIPAIVDSGIDYFHRNIDECTGMRSAEHFEDSIYKFFKLEGKYWGNFFPDEEGELHNRPRQLFPKNYTGNGHIDILKTETFMKNDTLLGDRILAYITAYTPDVDTQEDFDFLEYYYENIWGKL